VGIVGPTNSGKSTLVNTLVGQKVSIVSKRAQTTYHGVRGILSLPEAQLVFTDTPGFQHHPESVARLLNRVADRNAKECDLLVWVFDASNPRAVYQIEKLKEKIAKHLPAEKSLCVLNKVDKIAKDGLLPMLERIHAMGIFSEIIPLSALKAKGTPGLVKCLLARLPEGPSMFPEDVVTDRPQQFLVSELVREKIYEVTRQEIPYSVRVDIEEWDQTGKCPTIRAVIHVDAPSRKAILIGKGGNMLKEIGTKARADVEKMVGGQVCLKLHVTVEKDWKSDKPLLGRYLEL